VAADARALLRGGDVATEDDGLVAGDAASAPEDVAGAASRAGAIEELDRLAVSDSLPPGGRMPVANKARTVAHAASGGSAYHRRLLV
jgi:hypothetical protein